MISLHKTLQDELRGTPVSFERFQTLAIRLLDTGVLSSGDSQLETELYQDAARVEELLHSYFDIIDCTLFHDHGFEYMRLYPPGSDIPGQDKQDNDVLPKGLRMQLSQGDIASALVLRFLYSEAMQNASLDEDGEAMINLEAFNTTMATQLKRTQPLSVTERRSGFGRLRALKLINFPSDLDVTDPNAQLAIRPLITSLIPEQALADVVAEENTETAEVDV
ncbi:MAG: DUF4194 domain-containing protein [Gammaproteobacteria bacterium]|nr:DUF4194 domain-containing protein [Gammaproteobacteria bacterium]